MADTPADEEFVDAFRRLPPTIRGNLIAQTKLVTGMSHNEKAYAARELGAVKRELLERGEIGVTMATLMEESARLLLAGFDAGKGRDRLTEIRDPDGPWTNDAPVE